MTDEIGPKRSKKIKVKNSHVPKKRVSVSWILLTLLLTFTLSVGITLITNILLQDLPLGIAFCVLVVIISLGIIFDILGIAVTAAAEAPFHAMASSRVKGAKESVSLIRNAEKVSNFCNDVVGDICGIISGSAATVVVTELAVNFSVETMGLSLLVTGVVAALTVGGKALGKTVAMTKCNSIVYIIGKIIYFFKFWNRIGGRKNKNG